MLTQKDLYDYIKKNGPDAYDQMAKELANNINSAKAAYDAEQKKAKEKAALLDKRKDAFMDLFYEWWSPEDIAPLSYDALAKTVCEAVDNFAQKKTEIMKHAKNIKTKTYDTPEGKTTVTTGEVDPDEVLGWIDEILDLFK